MAAVPLLLLAASLAASAEPAGAEPDPRVALGKANETVRSSLADLDKALRPLEELTASYAADTASPLQERRGTLRNEVSGHAQRLNRAYDSFWPLWDLIRFSDGARLMGGLASGERKPEEGAGFLDDTAIDDFKAEVARMQERAAAALKNEGDAYDSFEKRRGTRRAELQTAAGAGAAATALAAVLIAWLRSERSPARQT